MRRDVILVTPKSALVNRDRHLEMLYGILSGHGYSILPFSAANARRYGRRAIWHIHWIDLFHTGRIRSLPMRRHCAAVSLARLCLFLCQVLLSRVCRVKILWTVHNLHSHERPGSFFEKLVTRLLLSLADRVTAVNGHIRDEIASSHGRSDLALLRQGLYRGCYPDTVTREEARRRLGLADDDFVLVFLGVIEEYKGIDLAMEALGDLADPAVKLVVAGRLDGESPYAREVRELARKTPGVLLIDRFVPDDEVQLYFRAADYSIYPYRRIDNSGPLYLTLSFGIPTIMRSAGGVPEILAINPKVAVPVQSAERDAVAAAIRIARGRRVADAEFDPFREKLSWQQLEGELLQVFHGLQDESATGGVLSAERHGV